MRFPRQLEAGLSSLAIQTSDQLKKTVEAITKASPEDLVRTISHHSIGPEALEPHDLVITIVAGLESVRQHEGLTVDDLIEAVCQTMDAKKIQAPSKDWTPLKAALKTLLLSSQVRVTAKAMEVLNERERVYCDSRIVTDVRPVFKEKVEDGGAAGIITHTLRVSYHEGSDTKQFYLAVDGTSLTELEEAIARAKAKESSLRSMVDRSGMQVIST